MSAESIIVQVTETVESIVVQVVEAVESVAVEVVEAPPGPPGATTIDGIAGLRVELDGKASAADVPTVGAAVLWESTGAPGAPDVLVVAPGEMYDGVVLRHQGLDPDGKPWWRSGTRGYDGSGIGCVLSYSQVGLAWGFSFFDGDMGMGIVGASYSPPSGDDPPADDRTPFDAGSWTGGSVFAPNPALPEHAHAYESLTGAPPPVRISETEPADAACLWVQVDAAGEPVSLWLKTA